MVGLTWVSPSLVTGSNLTLNLINKLMGAWNKLLFDWRNKHEIITYSSRPFDELLLNLGERKDSQKMTYFMLTFVKEQVELKTKIKIIMVLWSIKLWYHIKYLVKPKILRY